MEKNEYYTHQSQGLSVSLYTMETMNSRCWGYWNYFSLHNISTDSKRIQILAEINTLDFHEKYILL